MKEHHHKAVNEFLGRYSGKNEFLAILLAGSLAHGYAKEDSDVDIILVSTEEEYERRKRENMLTFPLWDISPYPGGYVDCKVVSPTSLQEIAHRGSDPARYAFKDARILYSRNDSLLPLLKQVTRFPIAQKSTRQHRFVSQLLAWTWYMSQAEEKNNPYLLHLSTHKVVLFACRVILNHNEQLYPYHKWLLEETKRAVLKPEGFQEALEQALHNSSFETAQKLTDVVLAFVRVDAKDVDWANQFLIDSEMNWLTHEAPVDDV